MPNITDIIPPVRDWKGNEVKPGMVIYYIQTIINHMGLECMRPDRSMVVIQEPYDEPCWIMSKPYEVVERTDGGLNVILRENGYTFASPIKPIFSNTMPLIAIKGISDHEPESILNHGTTR